MTADEFLAVILMKGYGIDSYWCAKCNVFEADNNKVRCVHDTHQVGDFKLWYDRTIRVKVSDELPRKKRWRIIRDA